MATSPVLSLSPPTIPERLEQIDAGWMTAALRSTGVLERAAVTRVRAETLGEGEGFVGLIARLHLEFDPAEPGAPSTLIAKLPTPIGLNRALGEMLGAYEREIRFYAEFADEVGYRVPRCYYQAMESRPFAGREEEALRLFDRIPTWVLRLLLPVLLWIGGRTQRKYVLLLEDLSDARVGDQVAGCSADDAERIVRTLAANQAALWNSPKLEGRFWLADFDAMRRVTQLSFRRNTRAFFRLYGARLNDAIPPIVEWLDRNGLALIAHLGSKPHGILHGDFRLDNLFFRDDPGAEWLTVIDWQGVGFGRGVYDLSYFITGNLAAQTLRECEASLVRAYHAELVANGVGDYPFEVCWNDHQLAKLMLLHRLISGAGLIDLSHERGQKILDRMFEGMLATLPTDDLDGLLASAPGA